MNQELHNDDKGRYIITTATGSHYCLDLDSRTMVREMAATAPLVDFLDVGFSQLRRDGESIQLLMVEHCKVGEPARLWIQVRDGAVTLRTTSPVVRIERVGADHG